MIFDQANSEPLNNGTISDGAVIAASGVRLTNSDSGRIYGGVTFNVGGSALVNQLGGVIRLSQFDQTIPQIVTGSDGSDTVFNAGLISGTVALGGGADTYVDRDGSDYGINLGAGDDVYRREGTQALFLRAEGGEGRDRVVLAGTGQYWGSNLTGFEDLTIETGGNFTYFSGFQSISLAPTAAQSNAYSFVNFLDSLNPTIDLALAGHSLMLHRSSLRSISGSDAAESVELGFGNTISSGVALGGGDDSFHLGSFRSADVPVITAPVDGGSGVDTLMLTWHADGHRTYDLASFEGFEKLNVNAWYGGITATASVTRISGLSDIDIGSGTTLILSESVSPNARAGGGFGGGLTLEAGTVIARYAFPDGPWDQRLDIAQGDPALSTTILNRGTINGEIRFYTGDDTYDGRAGSVGATVYGNAGNDTLLGGAGAETMHGGFGADTLEGNGGADRLTGGAGNDVFRGTAAGLNGDTIADFAVGDRILISNASLAGFAFSLSGSTLTYSGGSLTLSGITGAQFAASAASGGGVQLSLVQLGPAAVPVSRAGDFNGDGRDDILWRHDDGRLTDWLSTASGGYAPNSANLLTRVATDWHIVGAGDFNGDGRDDIMWRHTDGRITNWVGTTSGSFADNIANAYNGVALDWKVAGIGDFNGDGRDDILWRNVDGRLTDWLSTVNGGYNPNSANLYLSVSTEWQVVGTGDFNGDGRDDIMWRHTDGRITNWVGTANGGFADNVANAYNGVALDWQVAGIGDFNGDGRDDILWRNVDGRLTDWLSTASGGYAPNSVNLYINVANEWQVETTGDYNGDGRDDIMWRHADGRITNWLGSATGGFADNVANAYNDVTNEWHVQPSDYFA